MLILVCDESLLFCLFRLFAGSQGCGLVKRLRANAAYSAGLIIFCIDDAPINYVAFEVLSMAQPVWVRLYPPTVRAYVEKYCTGSRLGVVSAPLVGLPAAHGLSQIIR